MTDETINRWGVFDALRDAQALCATGSMEGAGQKVLSALEFLDGVEGPEAISMANALQSVAKGLNRNAPEGVRDLAELAHEVQSRVPDFRIVLLEETSDWDEAVRSQAGNIFSAYLYDARRVTYLAELQPSYELHHLYTTATNTDLPDDVEEALQVNGGPDDGAMYVHVRAVDAIPWERKSVCVEPADTKAESYDALVESEIESYRANVDIQLPRTLGAQQAAFYAQRLIERGAMDEANALVDAMPLQGREIVLGVVGDRQNADLMIKGLDALINEIEAQRAASSNGKVNVAIGAQLSARSDRAYHDYIEQMRKPECLGWEAKVKSGSFGSAELQAHTKAGELLGATRAYAEAATLSAAAQLDDRSQKASKFISEVLAEYESLQLLAEHFGTSTLADVTHVMASIVQGTNFEVWPSQTTGSRIDEVVSGLPSSDEWFANLKFMNKYGDQVPHSVFQQEAPEDGAAPSI